VARRLVIVGECSTAALLSTAMAPAGKRADMIVHDEAPLNAESPPAAVARRGAASPSGPCR
jgi:hypothetical protein